MLRPDEHAVQENIIDRFIDYLPKLFYRRSVPFEITGQVAAEPIPFEAIAPQQFTPFEEGAPWGENWHSGWFRLRATVPAEWRGEAVTARINFGGEACIFSEEGEPLQGLTGSSAFLDPFVRDRYRLYAACEGGEHVDLLVEAAANRIGGVPSPFGDPVPDQLEQTPPVGRIETARLCTFDNEMHQLWCDAFSLRRLMQSLPDEEPQRSQILEALSRATERFRYLEPNPADTRRELSHVLSQRTSDAELATRAVGHAHLDTAWLWPMRESIRKCARTFSTQLNLIERYPDYVFGASQPQHYQFVKDHYPGLYERIREAVREGRWEPQGAMWIEADCNLPSGESLARQMLYGKQFFQDEFGVNVRHVWLPDVFGYNGNLPQIMRLAGVDYFVTTKLSWSQYNTYPHTTFHWKGIDGSSVLTHLPPEGNYNAQMYPDRLRAGARAFAERGYLPTFLTPFGIGDGGQGATEEHLEFARRQKNLAGCPRVEFGPAEPMLDQLREHAGELPEWHGELYLEAHRGTLTTQAKAKRMNRALELQLRRVEMLWASAPLQEYPAATLLDCWRTLLTNQFHDILPGSSITRVYEDTHCDYTRIKEELDALEQGFLQRTASTSEGFTLVNTLSHDLDTIVAIPDVDEGALKLADGQETPVQPNPDGGGWARVRLAGMGSAAGSVTSADVASATDDVARVTADRVLENACVRYAFDDQGRLTSAFDKRAAREFLLHGEPGNVLSLYQDWPYKWDAWDVDRPYRRQELETAQLQSVSPEADGPHVAGLKLVFSIGDSRIEQRIRLSSASARLDFVTDVSWHETRKMLRVAFPVDVAANESISEIQYGVMRRPVHDNTSWDMAKFEVCAHRFADLSDADGGVALLNDGKYGHHLNNGLLDLNLLRSPVYPDPSADRGEHRFTYSLLPHAEPFEQSEVVAEAHALNQPPLFWHGQRDVTLPIRVTGQAVLETIKRAEGEDALIVRLYEPHGRHIHAAVRVPRDVTEARESDLIERAGSELPLNEGQLSLRFRPHEIKTLLLR